MVSPKGALRDIPKKAVEETTSHGAFISYCIRKNMPAVDSKTVPVARCVLTTPWLGENPPRKHVTETSPAGGHVNTEHSSMYKQLNKHSQQNNLALKLTSLTEGRGSVQETLPLPLLLTAGPLQATSR